MTNKTEFTPCPNKNCFDFLELLYCHMEEYYDKKLSREEVEDIYCGMCEDMIICDAVYLAVEKYADEKGWERTD